LGVGSKPTATSIAASTDALTGLDASIPIGGVDRNSKEFRVRGFDPAAFARQDARIVKWHIDDAGRALKALQQQIAQAENEMDGGPPSRYEIHGKKRSKSSSHNDDSDSSDVDPSNEAAMAKRRERKLALEEAAETRNKRIERRRPTGAKAAVRRAASKAFDLAPPKSLLDPEITAMLAALPSVGGSGMPQPKSKANADDGNDGKYEFGLDTLQPPIGSLADSEDEGEDVHERWKRRRRRLLGGEDDPSVDAMGNPNMGSAQLKSSYNIKSRSGADSPASSTTDSVNERSGRRDLVGKAGGLPRLVKIGTLPP